MVGQNAKMDGMNPFWKGRCVLVAGGAGFIGSFVVEELVRRGAVVTVADNFSSGNRENLEAVADRIRLLEVDLTDLVSCEQAVEGQEVVLNLAARVAGVAFNNEHPATMFWDNVRLNLHLLEAARRKGVKRFEVVSSACVYRRDCPVPTPETEGFVDHPEPSNFGYGWAKRMAEVQAMVYAKEYGMKIGIVRPYNAYGPRDHFDPERSHVIPSLIHRIFLGEDPLVVWGDGSQTRAFLYAEDFARGVIEAVERYPVADPINLGTSEEVRIKDLVELILQMTGRHPTVRFDPSRPSGQPRRNCDTQKAKRLIGFEAKVPLSEGLQRTIRWYQDRFSLQRGKARWG
jgi:GDP-L-fucose synthase